MTRRGEEIEENLKAERKCTPDADYDCAYHKVVPGYSFKLLYCGQAVGQKDRDLAYLINRVHKLERSLRGIYDMADRDIPYQAIGAIKIMATKALEEEEV